MIFLEWIIVILLIIPLICSNFLGVNHSFLKIWGGVGIMPFPSRLTLYSPIWGWFFLCWVIIFLTLYRGVGTDLILILALILVIVELLYAKIFRRTFLNGPDAEEMSLTHFGLWHNALVEELLFRGIPLLAVYLIDVSTSIFWFYIYIIFTSISFGLYHWWRVHPTRFIDTTLFGIILGMFAWNYGIMTAIFVHLFHNSLSVPIVSSSQYVKVWLKYRNRYLILLASIVFTTILIAFNLN